MTTICYSGDGLVSLPVSNLDKSERWYAKTLGLETTRKIDDPAWCEMATPVAGLSLGLAEVDRVRAGDSMLTLMVDDVVAAREQLLDRKADVSEVVIVDSVARVVTLMDPDGNALMLREDLT